ncbi:MAG: hypothetical protein SH848_15830 [Saprospiraceae bacterium]|nr:hypothetical protein [Saprospiraceae bacterium]MDZ4705394.1 hypothetical protein [Saprospiraceae bacterium]
MKKTSILFPVLTAIIFTLGFGACNSNPAESETQMEALNKRLAMFKDARKFENDQNFTISELQKIMVMDTLITDSLTQWFTSMMKSVILPKQNMLLKNSTEILAKSDSLLAKHGAGDLSPEAFEQEFGSLKAEHDRLTSEMEPVHAQTVMVLEEVKKASAKNMEKASKAVQ